MFSEVIDLVGLGIKRLISNRSVKMSGNLTHVLFENASGYALFEVTMQEEIVSRAKWSGAERSESGAVECLGIRD